MRRKMLAILLAMLMTVTSIIPTAIVQAEEPEATLQNDKIMSVDIPGSPVIDNKTYPITTWDTVYFGSYPQTEVTVLTEAIQQASYDSVGDAVIDGVKYRRICEADATCSRQETDYYDWSTGGDEEGYHYFKYEPIKWRVLEITDGKALLIADENLDTRMFHLEEGTVSWCESTIRSWLNGYVAERNSCNRNYEDNNFLDTAFSAEEQESIPDIELENDKNVMWGTTAGKATEDKVFLLTVEDVINEKYGFLYDEDEYGFNYYRYTRMCGATDYAKAMGAYEYSGDNTTKRKAGDSEWWLRSAGRTIQNVASCINGIFDGEQKMTQPDVGVRPALYLDLEQTDIWTYGGTVNSLGTVKSAETIYEENSIQYITANKRVKTYEVGDIIHTDDIYVEAVYGNGTKINVTDESLFDTTKVNMDEPGEYTLTVRYKDMEKSITITVTKSSKVEIPTGVPTPQQTEIDSIEAQTYTGSLIEPKITVRDKITVLEENIDYTVDYENNLNVGTAVVTVTGIGKYSGVYKREFRIIPKTVKNTIITFSEGSGSGKPETGYKPRVVVKDGDVPLQEGKDYNLSFEKQNETVMKVIITGIGNYTDTITHTQYLTYKDEGDVSTDETSDADDADNNRKDKKEKLAIGEVFEVGDWEYRITGDSEVCLEAVYNNDIRSGKAKKVSAPAAVRHNGKAFKVTAIGKKVFQDAKITSVTVGKNVRTIGASAFEGCSELKKVTLGSGVTKLGKKVFKNCKKLKTIKINSAGLKSVGKDVFKGIYAKAKIKVPKKKLTAYKKLFKGKGQSKKVKITK